MKALPQSMNRFFYLSLVFLFIFGDIVCNNDILKSAVSEKRTIQFISFLFLSILQIFAAPMQAALSDLYCRKKSLVFSLTVSLISLILLFFFIHTGGFLLVLIILYNFFKRVSGKYASTFFCSYSRH